MKREEKREKRDKRVYGVYGMIEFHANLRVGRGRIKVCFEGGSISGYGVSPAVYATDNPALQHIIEHSPEFQSGKIRRIF